MLPPIPAIHDASAGGGAAHGSPRDLGPQPLDQVMHRLDLQNHDLVEASREPLTHKMVQRGRKGRRLTPRIQCRILRALNHVLADQGPSDRSGDIPRFGVRDIFNY